MAISKLMNNSFLTRTISGALLVIIVLITSIIGGDVLFAATLAISLIGLGELYKVIQINANLLGLTGYIGTIIYYLLLRFTGSQYIVPFFIAYLMIIMFVYVFSFPKHKTEEVLMAFFGLFYVAVMISFIYLVRLSEDGLYTIWLIFICAWGCDTCAYLTGVTCGKHKLAPILSPKKSIEGAVGGVVGAIILGAVYGYIFKDKIVTVDNPVVIFAVICGFGALISMVGDLAASAIKRNYDIKDYGKLIPGHGGILDRFDSIIFTAPLIYYFIMYFADKFVK